MSPPSAKLLLVLGSGGVGKTTSAASLALALGESGLRAVVLTIDPAKRLAQALGLETLTNEPQKIKDYPSGGSVHALWLDSSTAFTDLVYRHLSDQNLAKTIVENRLFKIIQGQLGGIEEYLSVEKVLTLGQSGLFDVCVLDTPPSRHALDFIESPRHILRFFDEGILRVFISGDDEEKKRGLFSKLLNTGRTQALEIFKNFLGKGFLGELGELLEKSRPIHESLRRTAQGMEEWVRRSDTRIAVVSLLERYPLDEARLLTAELQAHEISKPHLLLLNKCVPQAPLPGEALISEALGDAGAEALKMRAETQARLSEEVLQRGPRTNAVARVPRSSTKALDTRQLLEIGKAILSQWKNQEANLFSVNSKNA